MSQRRDGGLASILGDKAALEHGKALLASDVKRQQHQMPMSFPEDAVLTKRNVKHLRMAKVWDGYLQLML